MTNALRNSLCTANAMHWCPDTNAPLVTERDSHVWTCLLCVDNMYDKQKLTGMRRPFVPVKRFRCPMHTIVNQNRFVTNKIQNIKPNRIETPSDRHRSALYRSAHLLSPELSSPTLPPSFPHSSFVMICLHNECFPLRHPPRLPATPTLSIHTYFLNCMY